MLLPAYDFSKLKNLESIKDYRNSHLFEIATGGLRTKKHSIKVRYIDFNGKFGYTGLGRFFFVDDSMYIITNDKQYESEHNPAILDFDEDLSILNYTGEYFVRVLFAGLFTGFYDDNGDRIFTGDVVKARVVYISVKVPHISIEKYTTYKLERNNFVHNE